MLTLPNVATSDGYTDRCTLGPVATAQQIVFTVANAAVLAQIAPILPNGTLGDFEQDEILLTPQSNVLQRAGGIRFRSAVAGVPAQIVAQLVTPSDPVPGAGTPFTAKLAASGAVTPGGLTVVGSRVVRTANQSIPNNVSTALDFTGVTPDFNDAGLFVNAQGTRLTALVAGLYLFGASVYWAASGAGSFRLLSLNRNGSIVSIGQSIVLPTAGIQSVQHQAIGLTKLGVGDYIEAKVIQDSGGPLLAITDTGETPAFWGVLLG